MAMIFVTHELKLVSDIADRVAVMYASHVVEEGDVGDVIAAPKHPYTRALISCIPRRDYSSPDSQTLHPIPGTLPNPLAPPDGCRFHPRCSYAEEVCRTTVPSLQEAAPGHTTACLRWQELAL